MTLRSRLSLAIIVILILFSINVSTNNWSNNTRNTGLLDIQQIVNGQTQFNLINQSIKKFHDNILFLSRATTSQEKKRSEQDKSQFFNELNKLQGSMEKLLSSSSRITKLSYTDLENNFTQLTSLWKDHLQDLDGQQAEDNSEHSYRLLIDNLATLQTHLIAATNQQAIKMAKIETQTTTISLSVLSASAVLTIALGIVLISYTNAALLQLKRGANIIGSGKLDYRIPIKHHDELGEVAEAFNAMSAKLQHAVSEVDNARNIADQASQAKSDFLANMSHELRTPLNAIIGYSEMMQEDIQIDGANIETQEEDLSNILTAGRHLLNQINDVLDFSKIEAGKMTVYNEEFDSGYILKDVINTITPLAQKGNNKLTFSCSDNMPLLFNDVTKFQQLFFNLLSNSCKFTRNGAIRLRGYYDNSSQPEKIVFTVTDNGIGMTEEQTSIIFNAFTQADSSTTRKYGGTGLGLALCKQYCELMNGAIHVDSDVINGTKFTIEFLAQAHTKAEA